ncbi:hypothetical protein I4U23_004405 [Adineta vaga]|nr:hypothetical protein I4U23_004405 [Adineta vaga]
MFSEGFNIGKNLVYWLHKQIYDYNLFALETDDNESRQSAAIVKWQKYTTWLYVLLVSVSLYVIFYIALLQPNPHTITINNVRPENIEKVRRNHGDTLSCPCSNTTIRYGTFISNIITFHSICSSIFVTEEWIQAFYIRVTNAYHYSSNMNEVYSQFKLLARLCTLSKDTMFRNKIILDNKELVSIELLSKNRLESEINSVIEHFKNSTTTQIISFINYLRITTHSNHFVSALRTNLQAIIFPPSNEPEGQIFISGKWTIIYGHENLIGLNDLFNCAHINGLISPTLHLPNLNTFAPPAPIKGFVRGCLAFEALLVSTLDCFWDIDCLNSLIAQCPVLEQMNLNMSNHVLSDKQLNISVDNLLLKFFVEQWSSNINYSVYFETCAPQFCIYTTIQETNFLNALTLLISLYGGLIIVCRLLAPSMIKIVFKFKHRSLNSRMNSVFIFKQTRNSFLWLRQLNLFEKNNKQIEKNRKQQVVITRVYLFLLANSFLIITLFTSLNTQTITKSVYNPTLDEYKNLKLLYSNTLKCPCSTIIVPYHTSIELSATLHQICSSDFISETWISILKFAIVQEVSTDWRNYASSQFQLLSDLCHLANKTIVDAISRLMMQSFISSYAITENDLNKQLNITLEEFFCSTVVSFSELVESVRLLIQIDQPFSQIGDASGEFPLDLIATAVTDETHSRLSYKIEFVLNGLLDANTSAMKCTCATNKYCHTSSILYDVKYMPLHEHNYEAVYTIPGMIKGCFVTDSLLLSTLECFYSNVTCFPMLMKYIEEKYEQNSPDPLRIDIHPLIYNESSSRFPPNTSISSIVKQMLIETWNPSVSYKTYYETCAPTHCTYSITIRTKNTTEVLTTLLCMISGITLLLRLLTPQLVNFIYFLKGYKAQKQQQQHIPVSSKFSDRIKTKVKMSFRCLWTALIELNIFSIRDFGTNIDRNMGLRWGQWATRLYVSLLIIGLASFIIHSTIEPRTLIKTFDKPLFKSYNHLKHKYGEKLRCSCSSIASTYRQYTTIEPIFHQICKSQFISDEWRIKLTQNLVNNLSIYDVKDYRRFLSAHLQFLQGLCELSQQSVNTYIKQFLDSFLITPQLLSETDFHMLLDSSIEQGKLNALNTISQLLFLIRHINHGNGITSAYGTNFQYVDFYDVSYMIFLMTRGIIYDNECDCGQYHNCTTQAKFIQTNSSQNISIKGLKMGCTPSESFLASTLECFYDLSCIQLIQEYTSSTNGLNYLPIPSTHMKRFSINTTVDELVQKFFVDDWNKTTDYSSYYQQCEPSFCSYTYSQKIVSFYTLTLLTGLQGGLTIVLKWITPELIRIIMNIYQHRKKRKTIVQPITTLESIPKTKISR